MESVTTRYRVNVATSVKGVVTWDCTVESDGLEWGEVLIASDAIVAQLKQRYPIVPEPEKGKSA